MKPVVRASLLIVLLGTALALFSKPASSNFFGDIWGIATDPLKLGKASAEFSSSLQRTLIQLDELERHGNYDVKERLGQIRSIVREVLSGSQDAILTAQQAMLSLEIQINKDANNLIYRAQCLAEVALNDQLQRAFSNAFSTLKQANPSLEIFGLTIVRLRTHQVKVLDPDVAYNNIKSATFAFLDNDQNVNDNSNAYIILSSYQNLERIAKLTRCHYLDQVLEEQFILEANDLERLSLPWHWTVRLKM